MFLRHSVRSVLCFRVAWRFVEVKARLVEASKLLVVEISPAKPLFFLFEMHSPKLAVSLL